jgi:hypothetical protein
VKYQIEYFPNPNCASIHVDQRLIRGASAMFPEENVFEKLSESVRTFCEHIHELEGINESVGTGSVYLHRYEIGITKINIKKGTVFEWEQILPPVLEALRAFIAPDGVLEEKAPPIQPRCQDAQNEEREWADEHGLPHLLGPTMPGDE